jgi:hypothetical protein
VQTAELFAPIALTAAFGTAVAATGTVVAVGAPAAPTTSEDPQPGAVYVYSEPRAGWSNGSYGTKVVPIGSAGGDAFGFSVAFAGRDLVVGAPGVDVDGHHAQGAVYVFAPEGNAWTQVAELTAADGAADDQFGFSLSAQNGVTIVGAPGTSFTTGGLLKSETSAQGAAYIFSEGTSGWSRSSQTAELTASNGATDDSFGTSDALSGSTAAVGAPNASGGQGARAGAVYVFEEAESGWSTGTQKGTLVSGGSQAGDGLGTSVSASEGTIAAGAPGYSSAGVESGIVDIFAEPSGGWENEMAPAELIPPGTSTDKQLGVSIALTSTGAIAGAPASGNSTLEGSALVFGRPASGWTNQSSPQALDAAHPSPDSLFGSAVASVGSDVIIGAKNAPTRGQPGQGAAYVFSPVLVLSTRQSHPLWRLTKTNSSQREPIGTTFTIRTNERAGIVGTLERLTSSGRHLGDAVSAFTLRTTGGVQRVRFDGRLRSGHRLTPGRYQLTIRGQDGSQPVKTNHLEFEVLASRVLSRKFASRRR